ncbi:alpha/beta hydrolase [Amycolatopsis mediterranei S699]|uniref:Alpha/beta hydrolase n=3 Tax=Amycolatopsis mediterranei TaxID=33910 RepID=A0A0H3CZ73_AMYMU|nr:alpha/beta fold hydrolase [Amycolatopsis mediterranei]ADJ43937.1 alpha/beta hydrolase [Amycolatopsis mediterranei U32]AEK40662.1 alpha/beta hydrolase [Amycolatopsis mediterranei S699]AFO75650.1 alpha/beta hydrolase [Amycolatopsis mediterranei S699]AGT82779.1 alpha/beta hydrolase [Amycolatopsis mediterranei RB]KDO04265.1 alpha/beta hydrolase [Amycolatopsis mediterranei]
MTARSAETTVRTPDGLNLVGTLVQPDGQLRHAVVLVHGGGVTRHEAGFFTRLAAGLAEGGVASLRFDLPGHGESEGRQEELSLTGVLNAIRAARAHLCRETSLTSASLVAASFSGGLAAYYAARRPADVERLVLFNPLLDYKQRFVDQKDFWQDDYLTDEAARDLAEQGFLPHSPSFKLSRALLNEVFWLDARGALADIQAPTLLVHGTKDTFIPVESSRDADHRLTAPHRLLELEGAQHGIAVHDDPTYADPQSQAWQAEVIAAVRDWLTAAD